ncbi:hypothetical protein [Nostoc piscinale]|uniref:hypothetical protein n=1 Tax=Nostoc piscinale TaxID=224012 RepID=UPI000B0328C6
MQDYRNQTTAQNSTENTCITENSLHNNEYQIQSLKLAQQTTSEGFSHKEMSELTSYTIKTIRSKASKGESIAANDGFTYRYDKDPHILKWIRV